MQFKNLSIRYKLTLLIMFISGFVLLLSSGAFILNDLSTLHETMEQDLKVQTRITGISVTSAVDFSDAETAHTILSALEKHGSIIFAEIYTADKATQPFSNFIRQDQRRPPLLGEVSQYETIYTSSEYLQYSQPLINPNNEIKGTIVLIMDREELYNRIYRYITIASAIVIICILIALLLSNQLQRIITAPILTLANLAHHVSQYRDYSLRAHTDSQDEINTLYQGFNEMLSAIQERDQKLEQHRDQLEKTVAARTAELKKLNLKLTYQAYHDALTNLPNRALFTKRVEQAIDQAEQNNEMMAMLFIDLDRFKFINDTLGHTAGDRLLQEIARRLLTCTRQPEDTIARLGGDEFTILLRDIKEPTNAGIVAEHIIKTVTSPMHFNQQELYITPSIGISIYPKDGRDVSTLMKNADASMYVAKKQGRNNYRFYTSSVNTASAVRLSMENKLRQALEQQEFEVWYQPRFDIRSGNIVSAEALIRWRSPDFNLVPPAQFIPLAEDTGLIIPIGEWVLRTACQENKHWQTIANTPIHVSVNLSARQFIQEDLLSNIEQLIEELQMDPQRLELELTESLIMPNAEDTIDTLRALKKQGIQISVDDFGTGYSSLSYLKRFPIDTLKIDQSFVRDINNDADDSALVTAIIAMAHNLKLTVVAEGVETPEQLRFLHAYNCDYAQGYLFGKPMPPQEFHHFLTHPVDILSYLIPTKS